MTTIHDERETGVEYTYEEELVTATDIETGIASLGEIKSEALAIFRKCSNYTKVAATPSKTRRKPTSYIRIRSEFQGFRSHKR